MATYYVDGDNGSDGNSGLTLALAFKTLNALSVLANNDTAILVGDIRSHNGTSGASVTITGKSGITIRALRSTDPPGGVVPIAVGRVGPATIWGSKVIAPGSWTAIGGGFYQTASPGTVTGMSYNYTFGGASHAYGHCDRVTNLGTVLSQAATYPDKACFCDVTGTITAYFGGGDPTSASNVTAYAACSGTTAAILLSGCTNCTISGLVFAFYPVANTSQFGWAVMVKGGTGNTISDCMAYDMGNHAFGTLGSNGDSSNFTVRNCLMAGATPNATLAVSHQQAADGTLSGHLYDRCAFRAARFRGIDDLTVVNYGDTDAAIAANVIACLYAHGDSGAIVAAGGIVVSRCTFINTEGVGAAVSGAGQPKAFALDNATAVTSGNRWTPARFPMLVDKCSVLDFIGEQKDVNTGHIYVRDTSYFTSITPTAAEAVYSGGYVGFGTHGLFFYLGASSASNFFHTFDSCTFSASLAGDLGKMFSGIGSPTGTSRLSFVNCSFYNSNTANEQNAWVDYIQVNYAFFEFYGCAFAHTTHASGTYRVCQYDLGDKTVGNFSDNIYFAHDQYSHSGQGSYPTAANWFASVDTAGTVGTNVLAASPYASPSSGLGLTATAKALIRTTSTVVPSSVGINGLAYTANFGAYQYPSSIAAFMAPSGPRLGAMIICTDGAADLDSGGVASGPFTNLEGFLASALPTSFDSLRTENFINFTMFWLYGEGSYDIGSCPSTYPGGAAVLTSSPLNQVNHAATAGYGYLNQIAPAMSARIGNVQSITFYGGCVASASATDNATLDSHSAIAETVLAGGNLLIAYDAQSLLDYSASSNPHKMHVDRLYSDRSVKTIGEAWERSDVTELQGWLARETAVISDLTRAQVAMGTYFTAADVATWHSVVSYRALGLRARLIIQNNGPTVQARLDTIRMGFAAGMDVDVDFDAAWTWSERNAARSFHRRIGLQYRERRERTRSRRS